MPRMADGDDIFQVKFECKEGPCETSRAVHISPHNSGTVIDSKKVQLTRIESLQWAFQRTVTPVCMFMHIRLIFDRTNKVYLFT